MLPKFTTPSSTSTPSVISRFLSAIFGVSVGVIPSYFIATAGNVEFATGLGMLSIPTLGVACWHTGRISTVFEVIFALFAALFAALFFMILHNIFGSRIINYFFPQTEINRGDGLKDKVELDKKIQEAKTDEELDNIVNTIELYKDFITRRRKTLIFAAVVSLIVTACCWYDLDQLTKTGKSFLFPMSAIGTEAGLMIFALPAVFVLIAIPLCIAFANYYWGVALFLAGASTYLGTAFSLFFCARNPSFQFWVIPLVVCTLIGGASLAIDWVELKVEKVDEATSNASNSQDFI